MQRADSEDNAHVWGKLGIVQEAASAAKKVFLTYEEIVSHDEILSDPPNVARSLTCGGLLEVMGWLQSGRVEVGFIGRAKVDRFGNFNTHWVVDGEKRLRITGSGGAADIATLAGRCIIIMNHERRRFVPRVHFVNSPGYSEGGEWIKRKKLIGGGPSRLITRLGIFSFDSTTGEVILSSTYPVSLWKGSSGNPVGLLKSQRSLARPLLPRLRISPW